MTTKYQIIQMANHRMISRVGGIMKIPGMWTYDKNGFKPVTLWMIIAAKLKLREESVR